MKQEENINLLQKVLDSVSKRGYKKTLDLLSFKIEDNIVLRKAKDKLIVLEVTKAFNISKEDLFYSRYERGELKYAIGFCLHYLYKYKTLGEIYKTIFKNKRKDLKSYLLKLNQNKINLQNLKHLKLKI